MSHAIEHPQLALVTGGTGGLGTAICQSLSEMGCQVIANYYPADEENALKWQQEQKAVGFEFLVVAGDISDFESCAAMAAKVAEHGSLSILINNAGITRDSTLKKMQPQQWQAVIDTNLSGLFNVSKQFIESMSTQHYGRIINISSINGQRGQFGQTNYSAAKAGVHGFTMALARETAAAGITVNSISPGFIDTDMVQSIPEAQRTAIIDSIPVGRVGLPIDIAKAVCFLADHDNSYITGNNLSVNGGIFMH